VEEVITNWEAKLNISSHKEFEQFCSRVGKIKEERTRDIHIKPGLQFRLFLENNSKEFKEKVDAYIQIAPGEINVINIFTKICNSLKTSENLKAVEKEEEEIL